ncbi:hypothetical protein K1Y78_25515 [Streptomyces sp. tea 10]|nr:hypothetical protein [Streptomyces sp. tea 10]
MAHAVVDHLGVACDHRAGALGQGLHERAGARGDLLSGIGESPSRGSPAFLGAHPSKEEATTALEDFGLTSYGRPAEVTDVALLLSQDRIVCWYTGRSEWGPRALGARSILADPTRPGSVARLNSRVKFREPFRPFGVSVDEDAAAELFDLELQRGCCTIGQVNLSPKPAADPSPIRLTGDGRRAGSVRHEYASAKQVEVGATVVLPLDQLDSRHLAFDLPGAPVSGQTSDDGVLVAAEQDLDEPTSTSSVSAYSSRPDPPAVTTPAPEPIGGSVMDLVMPISEADRVAPQAERGDGELDRGVGGRRHP